MRIVEPYVLIKEDPKIDHVGSIIIIDSKNLNTAKMGTVHMIGDKKENYRVKEGEKIAFNKVAGNANCITNTFKILMFSVFAIFLFPQ